VLQIHSTLLADNTTLQGKVSLNMHTVCTFLVVGFFKQTLNSFMSLGRPAWLQARSKLQNLLSADNTTLQSNPDLREK
jgi:hypothetical protein